MHAGMQIHVRKSLARCGDDCVCLAAGKTTFIKNLFASYTQDPNMKVNDVPGSTSKDAFVQHPDKLQTEIVVRDERNLIAYHYRVQDTPGELTEPLYCLHKLNGHYAALSLAATCAHCFDLDA